MKKVLTDLLEACKKARSTYSEICEHRGNKKASPGIVLDDFNVRPTPTYDKVDLRLVARSDQELAHIRELIEAALAMDLTEEERRVVLKVQKGTSSMDPANPDLGLKE